MSIILTDDLQDVPSGKGPRLRAMTVSLTLPPSQNRAALNIGYRILQAAGWDDEHQHVIVRASRTEFMLIPCKPEVKGAIKLSYSRAANSGHRSTRHLSLYHLTDALRIKPSEHFVIPVEIDGNVVAGKWPAELQERMAGVTRIRGAA